MLRLVALLAVVLAVAAAQIVIRDIQPVLSTPQDLNETDDPAIWLHHRNPANSLILGTIKTERPQGALAVYDLQGKQLERHGGLDMPNNVDVLGDDGIVTQPALHSVRTFQMRVQAPHLAWGNTVEVFRGESADWREPMGVALYRRSRDGARYAILSRAGGPKHNFLWEYKIDSAGFTKVRAFGEFSGLGDVEAVAVDHGNELVYYSDERCCVRVYRADPDAAGAGVEIARFATKGFKGDREGIAITDKYIIVTDQISPRSEFHVFDKTTYREVAIWRGVARQTDGIAATSVPLGPRFPRGILVAMHEGGRNFQFYGLF